MEELSKFLDVSEDNIMDSAGDDEEEDYIPESLASFVAEANRKLADAKLNFLTQEEETSNPALSPSPRNQSMDTTTNTVILMEDDDDIQLKKQLLDRLRPSTAASSRDLTKNRTAAAESTPPRIDVAKKELFPAGSSFDDEDMALEKDIASFFQVDVLPPMPSQGIAELSKKAAPETKQEPATIISKTPVKQQKGRSNQESTSGSSSSFWGSLTSKLVGTPLTAKTAGGSSSSVTKNKTQVAPDSSILPNPNSSDVKQEKPPFDEPLSPNVASGRAEPTMKHVVTAPVVGSSPVRAKVSKQPETTSRVATLATGVSTAKLNDASGKKSPGASALPAEVEKKPKKPTPVKVEVQGKHVVPVKSVLAAKSPELKSPGRVHKSPEAIATRPHTPGQPQTPVSATGLPSMLGKKTSVDDFKFLPNIDAVRVEKTISVDRTGHMPKPQTNELDSRKRVSTSSGLEKQPVASRSAGPATVMQKVAPVRKEVTKPTMSTSSRILASRPALAHISPDSENTKKASNPADAVAKARERVRQRQLMEKKKSEEDPAAGKRPPLVTATRAMRSTNKPAPLASTNAPVPVDKPRVGSSAEVRPEATKVAEEERRARVAEKVRLVGSGSTAAKVPRVATSSSSVRPLAAPTPANGSKNNKPKLTTPKPFHFHGKDPVHPIGREDTSSVGMTEAMQEFMRRGLRHSTPSTTYEKRPKITTPKPFTFDETSPAVNVTPATTMEEKKKSSTLGEKLRDYDKHLRDSGPPIVVNRDEGPTIPMSPKFTPVPIRERPKSTIEREQELMEYYENHPFKATPILTEVPNSGRGLAGIPKVLKKKLTVPKPFRLSTETRGVHAKHQPMPSQGESVATESKGLPTRPMPSYRVFKSGSAISPEIKADEEELRKQFHARPMPDFKVGSKLTPVLPKRFNSLRANTSKADKAINIPSTIEVRKTFSHGGVRVTPSPLGSSVKSPPSFTKPMPFRFASSSRARPVAGPDDEELKKQFKARPLPISTFAATSSTASPSRASRVPSTISISSGPKLATEDRREQREAAMLASRINAELLIRERASIRQRKQEEKHKEEMRKATLPSPTKLKAESMRTFHVQSDLGRDTYQRKLKEQSEEEDRERIRNFDLKANPKPSFDLSPTKLY
ncbi:hypothetical protein MHU86_10675 [Fragilaria crotonensis]|nr:hypothetical protein MHU86_10675 [Fragilaria crotonensis]